ncbi:hypothetical protein EIP91_007558 [Steccherinum ochraceum]|uniref:Uncharacterized protein n=1 Tax=Steccherinum ochraceum TaxID=92696 RepID=A0A4R0RQG6_9APHY|nr:hypothetical protein EIP91_007558 [Steccherinum ochraceum]
MVADFSYVGALSAGSFVTQHVHEEANGVRIMSHTEDVSTFLEEPLVTSLPYRLWSTGLKIGPLSSVGCSGDVLVLYDHEGDSQALFSF